MPQANKDRHIHPAFSDLSEGANMKIFRGFHCLSSSRMHSRNNYIVPAVYQQIKKYSIILHTSHNCTVYFTTLCLTSQIPIHMSKIKTKQNHPEEVLGMMHMQTPFLYLNLFWVGPQHFSLHCSRVNPSSNFKHFLNYEKVPNYGRKAVKKNYSSWLLVWFHGRDINNGQSSHSGIYKKYHAKKDFITWVLRNGEWTIKTHDTCNDTIKWHKEGQ